MAYFPTLDPMALHVLQVLLERSNIPGFELMKRVGTDQPDELMKAIDTLRKEDLVQVSGNVSNPKDFPFASFAVRPSVKDYATVVAKQSPRSSSSSTM